jgi:uncharacterized protein YndB with AHSA1/START domain
VRRHVSDDRTRRLIIQTGDRAMNPAPGTTAQREVLLTRIIEAPRDLVFAMWTDAKHVARWWGPKGYSNPVCEVDARTGGAMKIVMRAPDGAEHPMTAIFHEVVAPERLVFVATAIDKAGTRLLEAHTTVTFAAQGTDRTKVTVEARAIGFVDAAVQMLGGMEQGWSQTLDRLAACSTPSTEHGSFTIERRFKARPALVFAAWADASAKARWFYGPPGWQQQLRTLDFKVGGREQLIGTFPNGTTAHFDAHYHDIVPDRRIVYSYGMHLNDWRISVSLTTVTFALDGAGTRMSFTEQAVFLDGYDDAGSRERGSSGLLDQLVKAIDG